MVYKGISRAILFYFTDCKAIEILTTQLEHYRFILLYNTVSTALYP